MNIIKDPDVKEQLWEIFTRYALECDPEDYVHMTKAQFRRFFRDLDVVDGTTDIFKEGLLSESQIDVVFRKSVKRCKQCKGKARICFQDFLASLCLAAEEIYDSEKESSRLLQEALRRNQSERIIQRFRHLHEKHQLEHERMSILWSMFSKELNLIYESYCSSSKMNVKEFLRCTIELGLTDNIKTRELIVMFLSYSFDRPLCESYPHHIEFSKGFRNCIMSLARINHPDRSEGEEKLDATLFTIWKHLGDSKRRSESSVKPFYDAYETKWRSGGHVSYIDVPFPFEKRDRLSTFLSVNYDGTRDWSDILIPLARRRPEVTRLILARGRSLLHFCSRDENATTDSVRQVADLWPKRAIFQRTFLYHESCLHLACKRQGRDDQRRVNVVTFLLERDPDSIAYADKNGMLPIHTALSHKTSCLGVVSLLLKKYPRGVSERDHTGMLPLHHAVQSHVCVEILELLVSAMPHACILGDSSNRLAFSLAKSYDREDKITPSQGVLIRTIVCLFRDDDDNDRKKQKDEAVRRMMKYEITNRDVPRWTTVFRPLLNIFPSFASTEDVQGKFPLHYACEKQAPESVIQDLLDLNDTIAMRRSRYGWLPLHYGINLNLGVRSVRLVLEAYVKGAYQKDLKLRYTPFHMGLEAQVDDEIMSLLLKHAEEESKKHCHACAACTS